MSTTSLTKRPIVTQRGEYAVAVRRARWLLRALLALILVTGIATTVVSFLAVNDALDSYREIVAYSAVSADAAQSARSALLAHHSGAADFLSQQGSRDAAADALARSQSAWLAYQQEVRRIWQNRSDEQFGEYAVFAAADDATWRYKADIDAMVAFVEVGDVEAAQRAFLQSHETLVREVLPALNGLESVKLESMEAAYATTSDAILTWQQWLLGIGGATVLLLLVAFGLTRFWLHYAWTWELALATAGALLLFVWFNFTLIQAANQVEVLVRDAYDAISGVQSVEALLTQAEALESMAIFDPARADTFLSDADEYLFLLEQQLCGELACTDTPFLAGSRIDPRIATSAEQGQRKYGLPRPPLVLNAATADFQGEPQALEDLRAAIQSYREANARLNAELAEGATASVEQQVQSRTAYRDARSAASQEQTIARRAFNDIYSTITAMMNVNRWLTLFFTVLALLGVWGLRRRRQALFP